MTTKHTPGPWRIGDNGITIFGPKTELPSPVTIAKLLPPTVRVDQEERKANALLIAAAPDLLVMLQRLLDEVKMSEAAMSHIAPLTLEQASNALAKTKGK